jgi:hypothetical protein
VVGKRKVSKPYFAAEPIVPCDSVISAGNATVVTCSGSDMAIAVVGIRALNTMTTDNDARAALSTHGFNANIVPPEFVCNQELVPDCISMHLGIEVAMSPRRELN